MPKDFKKLDIANNYINDYVESLEEEKPGKETKKEVQPKAKTQSHKAKGRKPGAQVFKARKQAPKYKIVTIRFREEEYTEIYNKIIAKHSEDYASLTDYIKSLIIDDLNK